jgi:hypothetical protein
MRTTILIILGFFSLGLGVGSISGIADWSDELKNSADELKIKKQPVIGVSKADILKRWGAPNYITHPQTGEPIGGKVQMHELPNDECWWYGRHIFEFKDSDKCTNVDAAVAWY